MVPGRIAERAISPDSTLANLTDENGPTTDFARMVYPDEDFGGTGYENQTLSRVFWLNEDQTRSEVSVVVSAHRWALWDDGGGMCMAKGSDRCRATGVTKPLRPCCIDDCRRAEHLASGQRRLGRQLTSIPGSLGYPYLLIISPLPHT
jgi:hypothetical protein